MNLIEIYRRFPDQEACIEHLEEVRWGDDPACPHCGSVKVARKADGQRVGRWNCHDCHGSFNVLSGTVFCKTRVDLQRWFLAIGLIVNAKKSLSSHQLARDLGLTQPTARYMQHRIRAAMVDQQAGILQGIVEADETYVGGKPRKANRVQDRKPAKSGRGTDKTPVLGAVERGGNVVAMASPGPGGVGGKAIVRFLKRHMDPKGSLLITDQYPAYNTTRGWTRHAVINHSLAYVQGKVHTNTIEGFWSLLKRAWFGSHHHYAVKYMPLFVAEAVWKYNHRKHRDAFGSFLREAMA
jgi:transposase-like protein